MSKKTWATIGLLFITFLAAIQYIFLKLVPDSVSTFSFLVITNIAGLLILGVVNVKKLTTINKTTLLKGVILALELTGTNFFLLLATRTMDSVIVSSVYSMYFIFVTPLLLLFKKRVSLFSGICSTIAIVALLLMFGADTEQLFASRGLISLIIADIFFAAYIVSVSILGEEEDSMQLTLAQMLAAIAFAFVGWIAEVAMGISSFSFPSDKNFWIAVIFIGVFIRAVYGLLQITCQKYVPAINASLIFSSEIIMTLLMNPILSSLFHTEYAPATRFQVAGCVLFILATLMLDESLMAKLGYSDIETEDRVDENGTVVRQSSVGRKIITLTITVTMVTLILSTVVCVTAIHAIRTNATLNMEELGVETAGTSEEALKVQLEQALMNTANDKAALAEEKLASYGAAAEFAASYAESLYQHPEHYGDAETMYPLEKNTGIWAMQRMMASEEITYQSVRTENMLQGNMYDVFKPIVENNSNISTIYIGTETGLMNSYDPNSNLAACGGDIYYEYRKSDWYKLGKQGKGYYFTDTYQDGYGRGLTITCVAPFYDEKGEFLGCIGIDILMEDLNRSMVSDGIVEPDRGTLISGDGIIIASNEFDPLSDEQISIREGVVNGYLKDAADEILANKTGIASVGEREEARYVAYSCIESTGWILCISSPISNVIAPAIEISDNISTKTEYVVQDVAASIVKVIQSCLLLSAVVLICIVLSAGKLSKRITSPLKKLTEDVEEISGGNFELRTNVDTDDEIGNLARSFNYMTYSLQKYIEDLKEVTTREARTKSELSVATTIQADMLPSVFPAFPERKEFDIYASMTPAKEVGGDFYDFFLLDEDHLGMVIADVSGKGVPAALFMMIAKTLLKNQAQFDRSPKKILEIVNNQLCENNKAEMFVTVWLGIMEISTGKVIAANAGHEFPAIRKANGEFELLKDRHGFVLAGMEDMRYKEYEFTIEPGGTLFVYTDGVAEATRSDNELFGTDRMLESLNQMPDAQPRQVVENVIRSVNAFVGEAPQFDDITMLCMKRA